MTIPTRNKSQTGNLTNATVPAEKEADHQEDDEVNHHLNNKDDIHKENDPKHQKKRHQ